jgi:hypothetical protein
MQQLSKLVLASSVILAFSLQILPSTLKRLSLPSLIPQAAKTATGNEQPLPRSPIRFRDIAQQAGMTTIPNSVSERRYVLETMDGGGVALFDCDNDGKLDLAVVNDSTIDQYRKGGDLMVTLYHRNGNLPSVPN